jgi:hypothetical protein
MINSCDDPNFVSDFDSGKWEDIAWLMSEVKK